MAGLMTDPLTCPECSGTGEDRSLPGHVLKCMCCYGRGVVGGPDDPEENPLLPSHAASRVGTSGLA